MAKYFSNTADNADFLDGYDDIPEIGHVPDGLWKARVCGWKADKNHNGTPRVRVSFEILHEEHSGVVVARDYFFTKLAESKSKQILNSLGIDPRENVSDCPDIFVKVKTQIRNGKNGEYVEVVEVRLAKPPASAADVEKVEGAERVRRKPRNDDVPGAL